MRNRMVLMLLQTFLTATLYGQDNLEGEYNQVDEKGRKQGKWMKYYEEPDTAIRYTGQFVNNQPVDTFRHYYRSGKLQSLVVFDGEGFARTKNYYPNGVLMAEGRYVKELKDSTWKYYNFDERLVSTEFYIHGKKYGKWVVYHDNGEVAQETDWENNQKNGWMRDYYRNGNMKSEWKLENGSVEGEGRFFHENGKVSTSGTYHHDAKNGVWQQFDTSGVLKGEVKYINGIPEGGMPELTPSDTSNYKRKDELDEFDFYPSQEQEPKKKKKR